MRKRNWFPKAFMTGVVFVVLAALFVEGISDRAQVMYSLGCEERYYDSSYESYVHLNVKNMGENSALVNLGIRLENASLENVTLDDSCVLEGNQEIKCKYILTPREDFNSILFRFHIQPQKESFAIYPLIEKRKEASITGTFSTLFSETIPVAPSKCIYEKEKRFNSFLLKN